MKQKSNPIEKFCKICGKRFEVHPGQLTHGRTGEYCSRKCSGEGNVLTRISVNCTHCGNMFEKLPRHYNRAKKHYCSSECHYADIQAPKELIQCPECKTVFESKKARNRRFCSTSCKGIFMLRTGAFNKAPTSIEVAIDRVLSTLNIIYLKQFKIGYYVCDFYIPAVNLVIECDGDYWHSLPEVSAKDKRKDAYLKKRGYKILRLPEWKIKKHIDQCLSEIKQAI